MTICIYAASSNELREEYFTAARRVGELLAAGGHAMVYGGGNSGLMGACAQGLLSRGGTLTGIAPRFFDEGDFLLKDEGTFVFTDTMAQRKTMMEDMADAFIILPGGVGTMEEFFETLTLRLLGSHSKPIALLNTLGYYDALYAFIRASIDGGFTARSCLEMIELCCSPEQAVSAVCRPRGEAPARSINEYGK